MPLNNIIAKRDQVESSQGLPLAGGIVYLYEPGTTTFIQAFKDSSLITPHSAPIKLSGSGRANIWINRDCDIRIEDRNGNLILTESNANPDALSSGAVGGLLANGGFEIDTDANGTPDSWVLLSEAGATNARDITESTEGAASFRFTSSGSGGGSLTTENFFPVNDVDQLRITLDMRSTVAAVRNIVRVEWYDVSQISISNSDVYDSTSNPLTYTSSTFDATPPALARFAKLRLIGIDPSVLLAGSTYFDNVSAFYPAVVAGVFDNIEVRNNEIISINTNGEIDIKPNGTGPVNVISSNAVDLVDVNNPLNVGQLVPASTNPHLALAPGVIQAKADATNAAAITINALGGAVTIGAIGGALTTIGEGLTIAAADLQLNAGSIYLAEVAAAADQANFGQVYVNTSNALIYRTEAGVEIDLTAARAQISGTPVNNELAIWTAADTIEGDSNLTFSAGTLRTDQLVLTPTLTSAFNINAAGSATMALDVGSTFTYSFDFTEAGGIRFRIQGVGSGDDTDLIKADGAATIQSTMRFEGVDGDVVIFEGAAVTERFRFDVSTGEFTAAGPIDISAAAAGQIAFPSTANPSADPNTLDDYEEGTFTPTIQDASLSDAEGQTYTEQSGNYTKIGNTVFFSLTITIASLGTLNTSQTTLIANLPFTASNTAAVSSAAVGQGSFLNLPSASFLSAYVQLNTSYLIMRIWDGLSTARGLTISELSAGGVIFCSGHYRI